MSIESSAEQPSATALGPTQQKFAPSRGIKWFVILFVFDLVVRSVLGVTVSRKWARELEMGGFPMGLPTQNELREIDKKKSNYRSHSARYFATFGSIASYFNPWPRAKTRAHLTGLRNWEHYTLTWIDSRLRFIGHFTGTSHTWPMFAPNTRKSRTVVRGKLVYADGTTKDVLSLVEPANFTSYSRWLIKRPQKNDERLDSAYSARAGKCNYWSLRFPRTRSGAKLVSIELYKVSFRFPGPGQDVARHWKKVRAAAKPVLFWRYDVAKQAGKDVKPPEPGSEVAP
jgi:hypothetical protein